MHKNDTGQWCSDDGVWVWNGSAWQPVSAAPAEVPPAAPKPDAEHPMSPDGSQIWDGTAWVPVEPRTVAAANATTDAGSAAAPPEPPVEHPMSPDGHWQWDG